jgi:hypothetical protein
LEKRLMHACGPLSIRWLFWDKDAKVWRLENESNLPGTPISYCPFCGDKLASV